MMRTTSFLRFACLVFAWCSTRAEYDQARVEVPDADDTLQIHLSPRGVQAPGIKGCLTASVKTCNVRLHSVKTSGNSEYIRQLVTTADLPCFENSTTKAFSNGTTIRHCAEATAKNGLNSFSWESGACTAYLAWRPQQRADCKDGGSKVVYVVKTPLTPFEGGKLIVSGELNYDALPQVTLNFRYLSDSCGFSSKIPKGYKLLINGTDVVILPQGSTTYSLARKSLCSSGDVNISLWSVGEDGTANSNEVQMINQNIRSHWYGLETGACIYYDLNMITYVESVRYCNSTSNATLYSEEVDGGATTFLTALDDAGIDTDLFSFHVGLQYGAGDTWSWLGGLLLPANDSDWMFAPQPDVWKGAIICKDLNNVHYKLKATNTAAYLDRALCYFKNP